MTTKPTWVRNLVIVYGTTLALWLVGFAYVAYADTQNTDGGSWFGASGTLIMAVLGTGPVYFAYKSFRLTKQAPEAQRLNAERIFALQQVAGVPLIGGAVLGLLPALVNIGSFFAGMTEQDRLRNAEFVVPWIFVYVFAVTHLVVMAIRRGIRARELAATQAQTGNAEKSEVAPPKSPESTPELPADSGDKPVPERAKTAKLPIAPNLFFGTAMLLGYFTIAAEVRAWEMARNGELSQLESTGPSFSFIQFLDLTIGNFAAVVVLVFGLINWARDSVTFRKLATPIVAAVALAIAPGTVALGVVGLTGLSGDANLRIEQAKFAGAWIQEIAASEMPEGFGEVSDLFDCSLENCVDDADATVTFVRIGDRESNAESVCTWAITWAMTHGADRYAVAPDYTTQELEGFAETDAHAACVTSLTAPDEIAYFVQSAPPPFRLVGQAGEVPFQMELFEIHWGTQSSDPGATNYRFTVTTTFDPDELLPGEDELTQGSHELNDLLTAIGQARLGNPDVGQNDGDLIRGALEAYPHDVPVTPIVEANGEIWFVELETSDGGGVMCVSIGPWDEEWAGQPDPGSGYGVSSAETFEQLDEYNRFGEQAWGRCGP